MLKTLLLSILHIFGAIVIAHIYIVVVNMAAAIATIISMNKIASWKKSQFVLYIVKA